MYCMYSVFNNLFLIIVRDDKYCSYSTVPYINLYKGHFVAVTIKSLPFKGGINIWSVGSTVHGFCAISYVDHVMHSSPLH